MEEFSTISEKELDRMLADLKEDDCSICNSQINNVQIKNLAKLNALLIGSINSKKKLFVEDVEKIINETDFNKHINFVELYDKYLVD